MLLPFVLAVAASTGLVQVRAGKVTSVVTPVEVAHARAQGGALLGWAGRVIRWRAPPLCAPAVLTLAFQSTDGSEDTVGLQVLPSTRRGALGVVPLADDDFELQSFSQEPVSFAVSSGAVEPLPSEGPCQRARWRLPPAGWPDFTAAAAFAGTGLVAWSPLHRSAPLDLRVKARTGQAVRVVVDGRAFFGVGETDALARVTVEVPPGVDRVEAIEVDLIGKEAPVALGLNPPPPQTDHAVAGPRGSSWLFRVSSRGQPEDGAAPQGATRVAVGAYLMPALPVALAEMPTSVHVFAVVAAPPPVDVNASPSTPAQTRAADEPAPRVPELPATAVEPSAPSAYANTLGGADASAAVEPQRNESTRTLESEAAQRAARSRVGPAATFNRTGQAGVALTALHARPLSRRLDVGLGAAVLAATRTYTAMGLEEVVRRWVSGIAAWMEVELPTRLGSAQLIPALGIGGAAAWRRVAFPFRATNRVKVGPLGVASLEFGTRHVGLSLQILLSPAQLGSDPEEIVVLSGVSFTW